MKHYKQYLQDAIEKNSLVIEMKKIIIEMHN
jgi:hypothetical protein